jgi:hypothetical protein
MPSYPTLSEIEINWRKAGTGLCIIVEGETDRDDPWFYSHWFGNEARQFTFFPQDGWAKVEMAVADLRKNLGSKKVYGLMDRDFNDISGQETMPSNGILRTPKYTLENYYLQPTAWYRYFERYKRNPERRNGWLTIDDAVSTLTVYYRQCIPISAYNWVLQEVRSVNIAAFIDIPLNLQEYLEHPNALRRLDLSARFEKISTGTGISFDLNALYLQRLNALENMSLPELEAFISGKYVLKLLKESLAKYVTSDGWEDVIGEVTDYCPPPSDIQRLLDLIWQDSLS